MRTSAHWLEEMNADDSLDIYRDLAYSHACESGPYSHAIKELLAQRDFKGLVEFEIDYDLPGLTPYAVKHAAQAIGFFQKLKHLEIGIDKKEVAMRKFLAFEARCKQTNEILTSFRAGQCSFPADVNGVIHTARRKIAKILGPVPSLSQIGLRFGPGATRGVKRKDASTRSKLAEKLQCSEDLMPMVHMVLSEMPHLLELHSRETNEVSYRSPITEDYDVIEEWCTVDIEVVDSKVTFQEKNAKTFRAACTEPGLNVMVQLGIGDFMARRLAAFGIDIRDQTLNQKRAALAVVNNDATVDLSSASDSISREIVFELLPPEWADLLKFGRSSYTILPDGTRHFQEKFSSMGNGYTFPLETLIFWSLAASCCDKDSDATAYGDDLIVPIQCVPLLYKVLHYCGFVVNEEKSYAHGLFRESCGKDYFSGFDVRPHFPKEWVSARSLFIAHNFYVRDGDCQRAKMVENWIHPALRQYGPDGYGDGHLLGEHPKKRPPRHYRNGYCGYLFSTFAQKSLKSIKANYGDYVLPSYSIYRRSTDELVSSAVFQRLPVASRPSGVGRCAERFKSLSAGPLSLLDVVIDTQTGITVKELSLPGSGGYKRVSIYTFG